MSSSDNNNDSSSPYAVVFTWLVPDAPTAVAGVLLTPQQATPTPSPVDYHILPTAAASAASNSSNDTMDILAGIFFVVAGAWLLVAVIYSFLIVTFLRMRARGELDAIYEPGFGRIYVCSNSRFYIPAGCIFKRYLHHLQQEQQQQQQQSSTSTSDEAVTSQERQGVRYMTTDERRQAMELLLWDKRKELEHVNSEAPVATTSTTTTTEQHDNDDSDDDDGPVCLICLDEFDQPDQVLHSQTCRHDYHKDCIMDWLQRHGTTECPCCRTPMVSELAVWTTVQRVRKQRRREMRRNKAFWFFGRFRKGGEASSSSSSQKSSHEAEQGDTERSEADDNDDGVIMVTSPTLESSLEEASSSEDNDGDNEHVDTV